MKRRRLFFVPALLFLPGSLLFVAVAPPHTLLSTLVVGCLFVAGCGFAVAGLVPSVSVGGREVPWYAFAGVADVALGVSMLLNAVQMAAGGSGEDLFLAVATGLAGLPLLFIGADYLRGGKYLDVSVFE
ncbi:hypothetical protein C474_04825 [Halogeometricum pallidum JCM 14848]|uniref:Uncharacterized protein n=1 Tax=Halogeometricum pallidum JCM 14848 TaxID=1227487 RepID=M0DD21_HALPD|nr:hypothetical protein [Halogeometricum pallidum]ELZ33375.1 hypothetical protein C474_04825 [Halogeometricum pallidum JCM 14848]